ncbi:cytidine deaminase [Amycolatopsis rhizosphaerae]|uniref:Cytidine deaminase n=1 Tax=Amycolatopsis rhizosphaerae TaxID=2053003 RepID=A0A558CT88_9PSEU|nr:cytidine deaminase [Amycolatopsis rhizosphaerae]TVT51980.1 cytidine deaminase [Amycolatopsis rhizosphaerae]
MRLDQRLIDAAIELLDHRWPGADYAVAAAAYLDDGEILTSVGLDNINAAAGLCAETGNICRAYTLNRTLTASVCVGREGDGPINFLAPCGICQERLALWGPGVEAAVPKPGEERGWGVRTLGELNPVYWATQFTDGSWPSLAEHR